MEVRHGQSSSKILFVSFVSGNYFNTLGVSARLGRVLSDADESPTAPPVAVLSEEAWRKEFGSNQSVVGSTIFVETRPIVVVGVAQRGFSGDRVSDTPPAIWLPMSASAVVVNYGAQTAYMRPENLWLWLIGRIRSGEDMGALQNKLSVVLRQWMSTIPYYQQPHHNSLIAEQHIVLVPAARGIQDMASQYKVGLMLLMLLSCLVLLVACANIANLMLVRGTARQPEISLRIALGAPRVRILRQILVEGSILSCLGGLAGIALAWFGSYAILTLGFPNATALPMQASPSLRTLAFAVLASLLTGVLFSAAPARLSLLSQPIHAMRGYLRSTARLSPLPQKILLVLQATLSTVLIAAATLTARSFDHLAHQPTGFATDNRYAMRLESPSAAIGAEEQRELDRKVQERLSRLGGITGVGLASTGPYGVGVMVNCVVVLAGDGEHGKNICGFSVNQINTGYLDALGVPILQGRNFTDADTASSLPVTIVDQAFAAQVFPHENPIGKRIAFSDAPSSAGQIVGVSGNIRNNADDPVPGYYYRPMTQVMFPDLPISIGSIVVHFLHPPEDPEGMIRRALAQVDPNLAISTPRTMDAQIAATLSKESLIAGLAMIFALLAATLASIGLYGVTSYIAAQRAADIAIRIALGSTRLGIVRFVLRAVMGQIALGILLGIPLALATGYAMKDQLYQLHWYDPAGLVLAILVLGVCSLAAEFIPARRAAKIDPMKALRTE